MIATCLFLSGRTKISTEFMNDFHPRYDPSLAVLLRLKGRFREGSYWISWNLRSNPL